MAFMALRHFGQDDTWNTVQIISAGVFTGIFALEAVIKIVGLGPRVYWASWNNRFDLGLAIGSVVASFFEGGTVGSLLRVFRILRVMRMLRYSKTLTRMLATLVLSLPGFLNVLLVVAVCLFIFAVIGACAVVRRAHCGLHTGLICCVL
jgi:hypothetical protein